MVQQKLVIKVQMTGDKCRTKALKLAAGAEGVTSVAIEGDDKSLVVVIGDEVDSVCLTRSLRKKVGYATIVSVAQLEESDEKKDEEDNPTPTICYSGYGQYPQFPSYYRVVSDPWPSNCFFM
ncbi:heavy metal-associated isoprenylated plant protein 47 [Quercus suber]|uniref:Heavy metal-associated isoprenylated plant protein 47 n=1 Tax=Quercus suber TaxID=58331 RepID=A0AAW0JS95_QUESU|nr:heavy metal-associated isoprenylated plant protein 47-like [Quercus suber]POF27621.1 heavy metal-associated isoprenylated plant protein 47 [Quercus suber]